MSQSPNTTPADAFATRWLLSLVTVSLGGYIVVSSLSGQFIQLFTGMRLELSYGVLLTLQLLFAVAVVLLGLFFAPTSLARRGVAGGIVVMTVLVTVILQVVRLASGFGPASVFIGFTLADIFVMLPLALGAAWLVVRQRPGLSFAALALVVIPALVHWAMILNGSDSAVTQLVMIVLGILVTAAIGWGGVLASRVLGSSRPAAAQQPFYAQQNDRPAERGPVI